MIGFAPQPSHAPEKGRFNLNRRYFVGSVGAVGGAMLGGHATAATLASAPPPSPALRVGVLLPHSRAYPDLGADVLRGMRMLEHPAQLKLIPVEYGRTPGQAHTAALKLLSADAVDVLVAFVCANAASQWAPLLERHGVPLLVGDAGANAFTGEEAASPWISHESLGYWQSAWATGRWVVRQFGPRAMVAVAPMDAGFDIVPAFARGLTAAGGTVVHSVLTHDADGSGRFEAMAQAVHRERPDVVYALASGKHAAALTRFWADARLPVPLVAGGMLGTTMAAHAWSARSLDAAVWVVGPAEEALTPRNPLVRLGESLSSRLANAHSHAQGQDGVRLARALAAHPNTPAALAAAALTHPRVASQALAQRVPPSACAGLCDVLGSRVVGTYLAV